MKSKVARDCTPPTPPLSPRSTAALMISFMDSVTCVLVYEVSQRLSAVESAPVVAEELERARPESAWRNGRDVGGKENGSKLPKGTVGRQWLLTEHVEHCAAEVAGTQPVRES